jgi:hypothetical protein
VLSESVANALHHLGDTATTETEIFVRKFDKFFDCLNGRNLQEHHHRKKPNLAPYSSPTDERLSVCELQIYSYIIIMWLLIFLVVGKGLPGVFGRVGGQCGCT